MGKIISTFLLLKLLDVLPAILILKSMDSKSVTA